MVQSGEDLVMGWPGRSDKVHELQAMYKIQDGQGADNTKKKKQLI